MTEPIAIRTPEAARLLGVSRRTLQLWAESGKVPHRRVGGVLLFYQPALEKWLENVTDEPIESQSQSA